MPRGNAIKGLRWILDTSAGDAIEYRGRDVKSSLADALTELEGRALEPTCLEKIKGELESCAYYHDAYINADIAKGLYIAVGVIEAHIRMEGGKMTGRDLFSQDEIDKVIEDIWPYWQGDPCEDARGGAKNDKSRD